MRPGILLPLVLLGACAGERGGAARPERPLPPEERDGNDREIVKLVKALPGACGYRGGRIDASCTALRELKRKLELKRAAVASRETLKRTLQNLLESDEEVIRLVAAESCFPHLREAGVVASLATALERERVAGVRAAMLRQLCWSPAPSDARARPLLAREQPEAVRAEAAACYARGQSAAPETVAALRAIVREDPSPAVRGHACAALGALRAEAAVPELAAAAGQTPVAHRCSAALAAVGSAAAYAALDRVVADALAHGRVPAQSLVALASFSSRPFFAKEKVRALLARVAGDVKQSLVARARAVAELARLEAREELRRLQERVRDEEGESGEALRAAIARGAR